MIDEMHLGMVAMHILHHGQNDKIEPEWMADELNEHGYTYETDEVEHVMRNLVAKGLLDTDETVYWTTERGTEFLGDMKEKGQELNQEVLQS